MAAVTAKKKASPSADKRAPVGAISQESIIPADFMQPFEGILPRRSDRLISALLYARERARASDPEQRREAQDLIARLWAAFRDRRVDPIDMMRTVMQFADADTCLIDGCLRVDLRGRPREERLFFAMREIGEWFPRLKIAEDVVRAAMWPPRGETARARAALAKALGWTGRNVGSVKSQIAKRRARGNR